MVLLLTYNPNPLGTETRESVSVLGYKTPTQAQEDWEKTQQIQELLLSLIIEESRIHMVEVKNWLPQAVLWPPRECRALTPINKIIPGTWQSVWHTSGSFFLIASTSLPTPASLPRKKTFYKCAWCAGLKYQVCFIPQNNGLSPLQHSKISKF